MKSARGTSGSRRLFASATAPPAALAATVEQSAASQQRCQHAPETGSAVTMAFWDLWGRPLDAQTTAPASVTCRSRSDGCAAAL